MPDETSPLNMGAPWDSISPVAGGADTSYDPRFGQELQKAMAQTPQMQEFRQLGAQFKVNADLMKLPQPAEEMSMKTDPKTGQKTVTVKTTEQNYQNTMDSATKYHQVLAGFVQQSQQAEMRLRMQEEQARNQSPWIQLATALAANMAQAKDLPGWVQAAGRTSAQLNPRPEEIGARRMAVIEQGAQMAEKGAALDIAQMRTLQDSQEQAANLKVKQEKEVRETGNRITSNIRLLTKPGEPLDPKTVEQIVQLNDPNGLLSPEQRKAAVDAASGMATTAKAGKEAEQGRKIKGEEELAQIKGDVTKRVQDELIDRRGAIQKEIAGMHVTASREFLQTKFKDIDERQATAREFRAYQHVEKGVEAVNNMRDAIGKLRTLVAENPSAVGPIEGRVPEILLTRKQAEVRAEFFTLLDAVRQQISGGTRFWNPQEFKNLSPKLAAALKTERVNLGIMDALEDFSVRGAKNMVKSNQDIDWSTRKSVFGDIADQVVGANAGGVQGPAGGAKSRVAVPTGTPGGTTSKKGVSKSGTAWEIVGP